MPKAEALAIEELKRARRKPGDGHGRPSLVSRTGVPLRHIHGVDSWRPGPRP